MAAGKERRNGSGETFTRAWPTVNDPKLHGVLLDAELAGGLCKGELRNVCAGQGQRVEAHAALHVLLVHFKAAKEVGVGSADAVEGVNVALAVGLEELVQLRRKEAGRDKGRAKN